MVSTTIVIATIWWCLELVNGFFVSCSSARSATTISLSKNKANDEKGNDETTKFGVLQMVPRIPKMKFDPFRDYYQYLNDDWCGRPLLIEGALSSEECQKCCDRIMEEADNLHIDLQQQIPGEGTKLYQCTLNQAIGVIMTKSNSQTGFMAFCEGLLEQNGGKLLDVQQWATDAKEAMFENDPDWFDFFPASVQPTDAVIVAGSGATSTLHRDPMEWTGTSLCLEGTKLWRFLEPPPRAMSSSASSSNSDKEKQPRVAALDSALQSYRLQSIAWQSDDGEESTKSLSAGWQSDFSLYYTRKHASIPSAETLAEMERGEVDAKLLEMATNMEILKPNIRIPTTIHTVIQKPGDLLLIPAHWWHQTYGLEPSVAIASQRCGKGDVELVFQHILKQERSSQQGDDAAQASTTTEFLPGASSSPGDVVSSCFAKLAGD